MSHSVDSFAILNQFIVRESCFNSNSNFDFFLLYNGTTQYRFKDGKILTFFRYFFIRGHFWAFWKGTRHLWIGFSDFWNSPRFIHVLDIKIGWILKEWQVFWCGFKVNKACWVHHGTDLKKINHNSKNVTFFDYIFD